MISRSIAIRSARRAHSGLKKRLGGCPNGAEFAIQGKTARGVLVHALDGDGYYEFEVSPRGKLLRAYYFGEFDLRTPLGRLIRDKAHGSTFLVGGTLWAFGVEFRHKNGLWDVVSVGGQAS